MSGKKKFSFYAKLFITFFKIGAITVGGGLAMVPVIRKEFVEKQKWIDDSKIVDIFAISQSLPGVIAINSSMYIGYELAGVPGLAVSALGVVMPSFIIILLIAFFMRNASDNIYLTRFFAGVRAAVVPMILLAAWKLSKTALRDWFGFVIAAVSVLATVFLGIDVIWIVLSCALAGYLFYSYKRGGFTK